MMGKEDREMKDWVRIDFPHTRVVPSSDGWYTITMKNGAIDTAYFKVICDTFYGGSGGVVVAWKDL